MNVRVARVVTATLLAVIPFLGPLSLHADAPQAEVNPKLKIDKSVPIKVFRPDLRITTVKIDGSTMTVTVLNECKANAAKSLLGLMAYKGATKASGQASVTYRDVPPLKVGASADVVFLESNTPVLSFVGKFYRLEIDPKNVIKEVNETNNSIESTTTMLGFPQGKPMCDPK